MGIDHFEHSFWQPICWIVQAMPHNAPHGNPMGLIYEALPGQSKIIACQNEFSNWYIPTARYAPPWGPCDPANYDLRAAPCVIARQ